MLEALIIARRHGTRCPLLNVGVSSLSFFLVVQQKATSQVADAADNIAQSSEKDIARAKDGAGKLGSFAVDVGVAGLQMGVDAAVGLSTGIGTMGSMGIRSFGGGTQQARQAGGTIGQQLAYGGASAAVELLTEKLADGLAGAYGKGAADDIAKKVIGKLARTDAGRTALRSIYGMGGEGLEEILSDAVNPALRTIYNGNKLTDSYSEEDISDWLYDGLVGAAVGGAGTAASIVSGKNAAQNAELRKGDAPAAENTGLSNVENNATVGENDPRIAKAKELTANGKSPSEIFNATGLVVLANGDITEGFGGETIWRQAENGKLGRSGENSAQSESSGKIEAGDTINDGRGIQPTLEGENRGNRSWEELTDSERAAAREIISERASLDTDEISLLMNEYGEEDLIKAVYDSYLQGDVAFEQWEGFFGDMSDIGAALDKALAKSPQSASKASGGVQISPTALNAATGDSGELNSKANADTDVQNAERLITEDSVLDISGCSSVLFILPPLLVSDSAS